MKKVFYAIIALIVLYFVLALFGPKQVKAERTITISAAPEVVREKLGDYRFFHEQWSPWTLRDPDMKTSFTGTPGQREQLQVALDAMEAAREIQYGLHVSGESVMSCYVHDLKDGHIHFIDGAEGGYTKAAGMLKQKLRNAEA